MVIEKILLDTDVKIDQPVHKRLASNGKTETKQ